MQNDLWWECINAQRRPLWGVGSIDVARDSRIGYRSGFFRCLTDTSANPEILSKLRWKSIHYLSWWCRGMMLQLQGSCRFLNVSNLGTKRAARHIAESTQLSTEEKKNGGAGYISRTRVASLFVCHFVENVQTNEKSLVYTRTEIEIFPKSSDLLSIPVLLDLSNRKTRTRKNQVEAIHSYRVFRSFPAVRILELFISAGSRCSRIHNCQNAELGSYLFDWSFVQLYKDNIWSFQKR